MDITNFIATILKMSNQFFSYCFEALKQRSFFSFTYLESVADSIAKYQDTSITIISDFLGSYMNQDPQETIGDVYDSINEYTFGAILVGAMYCLFVGFTPFTAKKNCLSKISLLTTIFYMVSFGGFLSYNVPDSFIGFFENTDRFSSQFIEFATKVQLHKIVICFMLATIASFVMGIVKFLPPLLAFVFVAKDFKVETNAPFYLLVFCSFLVIYISLRKYFLAIICSLVNAFITTVLIIPYISVLFSHFLEITDFDLINELNLILNLSEDCGDLSARILIILFFTASFLCQRPFLFFESPTPKGIVTHVEHS